MARSFSTGVTRRWAPEGNTALGRTTQRGLRSLAFADRLMVPYVTRTARPSVTSYAPRGAAPATTSWLFPVPWYRDELEWLVAARSTAQAQMSEPAARRAEPSADLRLEYIAPTMTSSAASSTAPIAATPGRVAMQRTRDRMVGPVRAWTPLVDFPAAQAAEVMASVITEAARPSTSPGALAPVMELLSPVQVPQRRSRAAAEVSLPATWAPPTARIPASPVSEKVRKELQAAARALTEVVVPASVPAPQAPDRAPSAAARSQLEAPAPEAPPIAPATPAQRAATLLAHSVANESTGFSPAAGPRVALPVGLGGLVTGLTAHDIVSQPVIERRDTRAASPMVIASSDTAQDGRARAVATPAPQLRTPAIAMPLLAAPMGTSAFEAIAAAQPNALTHVAWADRWLARFSGASTESLARVTEGVLPAAARPFTRSAGRAPTPIFLTPDLASAPVDAAATSGEVGLAAPVAPITTPITAPVIDDGAAVPDDVFERLARAAAGIEPTPSAAPTTGASAAAAQPVEVTRAPSLSVADRILSAAPVIAGAGLAPALASSPIAPALGGILDLPSAPVFDVRSVTAPAIARWYATPVAPRAERRIPAPLAASAPTLDWLVPSLAGFARPELADSAEPFAAAELATLRATDSAPRTPPVLELLTPPPRHAADPQLLAATPATATPAMATPTPALMAEPAQGTPAAIGALPHIAAARPQLPSPREVAARYDGRPGQAAQLAQSWSIEQERTAADLSFDFVPPELVMAARVYGFSPTQAAQAARLAAVGPAGLQALAAAVDLTFVQQLATAEQMRLSVEHAGPGLASPWAAVAPATPVVALPGSPEGSPQSSEWDVSAATVDTPTELFEAPASTAAAVLKTPARLPRGATLMPEATAGALQLSGAGVERQLPHARAALDLLAASVVADASVFPLLFGPEGAAPDRAVPPASIGQHGPALVPPLADADQRLAVQPPAHSPDVADTHEAARAIARQISSSAARPVPPQFESIYLSLSQSPAGRSMSPAVRAARALALAHSATPASPALERTQAALALVIPDGASSWDALGDQRPRAQAPHPTAAAVAPDMPAIELLAAGAGESLRSLVAPLVHHMASDSPRASTYIPPTASQPLVSAPSQYHTAPMLGARAGGGEVEIPPWFESAARKLFEQGSGGEQISIAEMILVNTAPAQQIAASPAGSAQSSNSGGGGGGGGQSGDKGGKLSPEDLEQMADEVYDLVMQMMETALMRQGGH